MRYISSLSIFVTAHAESNGVTVCLIVNIASAYMYFKAMRFRIYLFTLKTARNTQNLFESQNIFQYLAKV